MIKLRSVDKGNDNGLWCYVDLWKLKKS